MWNNHHFAAAGPSEPALNKCSTTSSSSSDRAAGIEPSVGADAQMMNQVLSFDVTTKTDNEISELIAKYLKTCHTLIAKRVWIQEALSKLENERKRKVRVIYNKKDCTTSCADLLAENKPSVGLDAQENEVVHLDLFVNSESEIAGTIAKLTKQLQTVRANSNWLGRALDCLDEEAERRIKNDSTTCSPDRSA